MMHTFKKHPAVWFTGLFIVMAVIAWFLPRGSLFNAQWYGVAWLINLILMLVILGVIGKNKEKDPDWDWEPGWLAILVDNRRMYSLSRFQIVLWTILVLSAFWTIAITRAADSVTVEHAKDYVCVPSAQTSSDHASIACASPINIQLPEILWALMGISLTSAVASPLIKSAKEQRTKEKTNYYKLKLKPVISGGIKVTNSAGGQLVDSQGKDVQINSNFDTVGAVARRVKGPPNISDMFMSEDPESLGVLSIGKVQNFFFTMIAVIVYAFALWAAIAGAASFSALYQFPDLSEGLVAIIGISHAAYLTNKVADTGPDPKPSS